MRADKGQKIPVAGSEEEMMRLRSVVAAQKWDIAGLIEQRDALMDAARAREETIADLENRLAAIMPRLAMIETRSVPKYA